MKNLLIIALGLAMLTPAFSQTLVKVETLTFPEQKALYVAHHVRVRLSKPPSIDDRVTVEQARNYTWDVNVDGIPYINLGSKNDAAIYAKGLRAQMKEDAQGMNHLTEE
jgi:hypothetical protein